MAHGTRIKEQLYVFRSYHEFCSAFTPLSIFWQSND